MPILLIKQRKQYVRAATTQGNTTFCVLSTAKSQAVVVTHPWLHGFPAVTCSVYCILLSCPRETGLNQPQSVAISLTVGFSWQKQMTQQTSPLPPLFFLPHKTQGKPGVLSDRGSLIFKLISFHLPIPKTPVPRNLSPCVEEECRPQTMPRFE